jgi:drug/metabolite transporter (DMT)-like permease
MASPRRIAAALAALYLVWGSTFVAVMVAIRSIPPLFLSSARYGLAGLIVLAWARRREGPLRLSARELLDAAIVGFGLLVVGTGTIAWAEQRLASGLTALLVATVPLWTLALDRIVLRERVGVLTTLGLVAGMGGVALLVGGGGRVDPVAAGAIVLSSLCWAAGSLYARRRTLGGRPLTFAGLQMVTAAFLLAVGGAAGGEGAQLHPERISLASWGAFAYLFTVGSLVGYLCYIWLNDNAPAPLVSTYAYVNPAVAVVLGWLLLGETVSGRTLAAGGAILASVVLTVTARSGAARAKVLSLPARVREAALARAA